VLLRVYMFALSLLLYCHRCSYTELLDVASNASFARLFEGVQCFLRFLCVRFCLTRASILTISTSVASALHHAVLKNAFVQKSAPSPRFFLVVAAVVADFVAAVVVL